jgi:glycosyltransferase EpsF
MFEEVKQAAAKLENADNFRFLGLRMDIPRILCASDVFVMPSLYEGFPVSMIEAQCAGLPCIVSSNITHEADCKKCKTAYLPFDIDMWKEKIESFIAKNDGKIDRDIAIKAIKDSKFDISDNIVTLCDLYGVAHDDER